MDEDQLESLYKGILESPLGSSDICPTREQIAEYVLGRMGGEDVRRMESVLSGCPECRRDVEGLRAALAEFQKRTGSLLESVLARLREETASVPTTAPSPRASVLIRLEDLSDRAEEEARRHLSRLLDGLREMTSALGSTPAYRPAPATRRGSVASLLATLADENDRPVLNGEGKPTGLSFDLIRADIEPGGRLILDLSVSKLGELGGYPMSHRMEIRLAHAQIELLLPPEKILPDGRVAVARHLPGAHPLEQIPPASLRLRLVPIAGKA